MMDIKRFVCNMLEENCYVVSDETQECIIIDCGAQYPEEQQAITKYIDDNKLTPRHLIVTHGHIDHNFGNRAIYEAYGLKPEASADDMSLMESLKEQAQSIAGITLDHDLPPVGKYLTEQDVISFGHHQFTILKTPGHSRGSVFYYCEAERVTFSGDTLFRHSIGRTDFAGGSMFQMIQSLRMISQLPDDVKVYPGHGDATTIGTELAENPYLDR
jgi:hydroxyacylglutathione hydrolase